MSISTSTVICDSIETIEISGCDELRKIMNWVWEPTTGVIGPPPGALSRLKKLEISSCRGIKKLFPWGLAGNLENLEELKVSNCAQLEEIIGDDGAIHSDTSAITLPRIKVLSLLDLPELKSVNIFPTRLNTGAVGGSSSGNLSNLREMKITCCGRIKTLFPHCLVDNLQNLEELLVNSCDELEEIIGQDPQYIYNSTNVLPQLRNLLLCNLPELKSIFMETIICDSIELIFIGNCEKLKKIPLFREGKSAPQNLKRIEILGCAWWYSLEWDNLDTRDALQPFIRCKLKDIIRGIPLTLNGEAADTQSWGGHPFGKYTCKTGYNALAPPMPHLDRSWRMIWDCKIPNKLMFKALSADWNLGNEAYRSRCHAPREDIVHVFRDCPTAVMFWRDSEWQTQCNHWEYHGRREHTLTIQGMKTLMLGMKEIQQPWVKMPESIPWLQPQAGWVKLNTNGSYWEHQTQAWASGVVRDENGAWVFGFALKLGNIPILTAEMMGLREGLKLAWERRFEKIEAECHSKEVVELILGGNQEDHPLGFIIEDCKRLIRGPWLCKLKHISRYGNNLADSIATIGHEVGDGINIWEDQPIELDIEM